MHGQLNRILYSRAEDLPVSNELRAFMQVNRIKNLAELLEYGIPELYRMDGFEPRCLIALRGLLEGYGAGHLLSQYPKGRINDF